MNYEGTIHTSLDGQTMVEHTPKAKFHLPAFHERGPSFNSQLSLESVQKLCKWDKQDGRCKSGVLCIEAQTPLSHYIHQALQPSITKTIILKRTVDQQKTKSHFTRRVKAHEG